MSRGNSFLKNKELKQAKLEAEKKKIEEKHKGTNQEQIGREKFQEIADQRFQNKIAELYGSKFDANKMMDNAKKSKKRLDAQKDIMFFKKWE